MIIDQNFIKAVRKAFPRTAPVLTGYLVLGAAYGMLMKSAGYGWQWTLLASLTTYAGSMQFVAVSLLASGFNPLNTALMTLMVNARHIFYGISMLGRYEKTGKIKPYLIFGLTDETFSVISAADDIAQSERTSFALAVTLLDHIYWISGSLIGNLLAGIVAIDARGLDFVLTALFTVIFIDQWKLVSHRIPALIGIAASVLSLWVFGPQNFIIPALLIILAAVAGGRRFLDYKKADVL